ncbi:hypothetical protein [Burkholderia cenocepacia]|uniref:hypothetical protein n=1 Tax=Burkholderia cenocepacia TaxID=95486 RepID=UPI001E35597A|nr:hypothetical protein [Burkholderia cenocepacia]
MNLILTETPSYFPPLGHLVEQLPGKGERKAAAHVVAEDRDMDLVHRAGLLRAGHRRLEILYRRLQARIHARIE